jgi:hypothetical protein
VPVLDSPEPLNDPLTFDVSSGYYGSVHSFDTTTPSYIGSTAALTNYDAYVLNLTLDFALVSLTVVDASIAPPALDIFPVAPDLIELSWPAEASAYALEFTTNLATPVWSPVTNDIAFDGNVFSVPLETSGVQRLFRLRK